jgi:hypothetical protein
MANYYITYAGQEYDLPQYTFAIADMIEKQEVINSGNTKFKDKCKSMYDLLSKLLGEDAITNLVGKFTESDPNTINIFYLMVVRAYAKPLEEYNEENATIDLDKYQVDKIVNLVEALDKASKIKV